MMRVVVVVTGGRDYADRDRALEVLDACTVHVLVHGGGPFGIDRIADQWAKNKGIPCLSVPLLQRDGLSARPLRNGKMLRLAMRIGDVEVIAFPGGVGTADCVKQARQNGLSIRLIEQVER